MLHHTLHIHPRLRQYRAGITTKNILDGPRLDRRLAADHRYQAGPRDLAAFHSAVAMTRRAQEAAAEPERSPTARTSQAALAPADQCVGALPATV